MPENNEIAKQQSFINRFRANYVSVDLLRIGGDRDGGYLIPDILNEVEYCFSPGVDYSATFEKQLADEYGIKSFMADASVDNSPIQSELFEFDKKFLGNNNHDQTMTLSSWVDDKLKKNPIQSKLDNKNNSLILQMDIESAEYDVLITETKETLEQFSCMIIEFHALSKIFDQHFISMLASVFEKIYTSFSIVHVHPNNCCGILRRNGIETPRVMEVTFLRNDIAAKLSNGNKITLPHKLDRKNLGKKDDITMPKQWWQQQ